MNKLFLATLIAASFFVSENVLAVAANAASTTQFTDAARFEVIQSPLAAKYTFLLDKYAGRVYQLQVLSNGDYTWTETNVQGITRPASPTKARYQILTSGIAAKNTILIDTELGGTWMMYQDTATGNLFWASFY